MEQFLGSIKSFFLFRYGKVGRGRVWHIHDKESLERAHREFWTRVNS